MPHPFFEPPFEQGLASVVWTRPPAEADLAAFLGPLEDVPEAERERDWPAKRRAKLIKALPALASLQGRRYKTCSVVGSSPELLLYEDGARIDSAEAVFRANMAVLAGFEVYVGSRTTHRVINPVESLTKARAIKLSKGSSQKSLEIIIKNQDPPAIRSPSKEHSKFLGELKDLSEPSFLGRRSALELCNFLMLAAGLVSGTAKGRSGAQPQRPPNLNISEAEIAFREFAAGKRHSWHPLGDSIPRFSPSHCSTGTVLLVQALLMCERTTLFGYHSCACDEKCAATKISARNHYWDTKETPMLDKMMSRYGNHMLFYQLLERACDLNFEIGRKEHCDAV